MIASFYGAEPPAGLQGVNRDGSPTTAGNVLFLDEAAAGTWWTTSGRIWVGDDALADLASEGVDAVKLTLHTAYHMGGAPVRTGLATLPASGGWLECDWESPLQLAPGAAITVAAFTSPGGAAYLSFPNPGPMSFPSPVPGSPLILSAADGETTGGGTWSARTVYRYGTGQEQGNHGSGWLTGADLVVTDVDPNEGGPAEPPYQPPAYVELGSPTDTQPWHVDGWLRTAHNTGLAAVGVSQESLEAHPATGIAFFDETVTGKIITADRIILGPNGRVDRCLVRTAWDGAIVWLGHGGRLTNSDVEITGSVPANRVALVMNKGEGTPENGADDGGILVSNVRVTGGSMFIWCDTMATIEDVYGYAQEPETGAGQHRDGFTRRSGMGLVVIRRSRLVTLEDSTTGALFVADTFGDGVGRVRVERSSLEGAGYCAAVYDAEGMEFDDVRLRPDGPHKIGHMHTERSTWTQFDDVYLWDSNQVGYRGAHVTLDGVGPPPPTPVQEEPSGGLLLDSEDLEYMRGLQDQARPTQAVLQHRMEVSDGMGGRDTILGDPIPVTIRVSRGDLTVAQAVSAAYGGRGVSQITLDLMDVWAGDTITVSDTEAYEVVQDGTVGAWATAQRVWVSRIAWPEEGV